MTFDDDAACSIGRFKSGVVSRDFDRVRLLLIFFQFRCVVSEKANDSTDSFELVSSFVILEFSLLSLLLKLLCKYCKRWFSVTLHLFE